MSVFVMYCACVLTSIHPVRSKRNLSQWLVSLFILTGGVVTAFWLLPGTSIRHKSIVVQRSLFPYCDSNVYLNSTHRKHCCFYFATMIIRTLHSLTQYTGCSRRNVRDFGRVFLRSNYTDITQNTYIQTWTVTEIMAGEVWNFDSCYSLIDYQIHIETGRNMWFL